ncbi:MAG: gliding motility-associated C-terminal domain-containing protein [Bacteroidota bacterium]|nr:gliding motility-associated C-terminal domain-containing protein [Bacteroidota bacterium]
MGTNVLQWTISNGGICPPTVSTVSIVVDPATSIANAGSNQTLCVSSNFTSLSANSPTSGIGSWSFSSGLGVFSNSLSPTSNVTGLALGTNVLQWNITSTGACPSTSSTKTIQIDPLTSNALAGSNQTICVLTNSTTLAANTPTSGTGSWGFTFGGGVFNNSFSPTTTVSGLNLGINVLQWSIASSGACPSTSALMSILVNAAPSAALAGPNQTLCISNNSTTLSGNTPTTGLGTWSVISGSGIVTSPNNPNSTVTGLGLGINILQWSVANGVCTTNTNTMSIQVDNLPTASIAGPGSTLCVTSPSLTMSGNVPSVGLGTWSQAFGTSTITSPNSANTTVTNIGLGLNVFLWTITNGVCPPSSSSAIITINPLPSTAIAGSNQTVCISSPTAALTGNTPAIGNGTWSVTFGSGTIIAPNNPTTTAISLGLGTNILQWSIGTVGCPSSISNMLIQVDQAPTIANAGANQTICVTTPTTVLSANTPTIGTGLWSIVLGGGTIVSPSSPTSSVIALPIGTNVLQWTITNGVCAPSISTMSIQVDNNAVFASAGPNQTLCAASPSTTLAGNTPTAGIGTWSFLVGSGSIATPTIPNTIVTGLSLGLNVLNWNIVNGVCAMNSSQVFIYVVPSPGVPNAGPNQTLCISSPTTTVSANSPSLGTASWSVVSGAASITTPATPNSSVLSIGPGDNILAWTMTYSVCSLTSTMNIHVDNLPSISNAGTNQTLCISSPTAVLAGNTPTSGIGTWSLIAGGGTITSPTLATSTVSSLSLGINIFEWSINGGGCGISTSTTSIEVDNLPTISNAGSNQTLCISSASTTLTGNIPVSGIGTWSIISGGGTITTPTLSNSSVTGLGLGTNVLQWDISTGGCSSASTMSIQVDNIPTISNAGPSQSICISSPTTILAGNTPLVGNGIWSIVSGVASVSSPTLSTSSVTGLGLGLNQLQWTISNGFCTSSSSTVTIQVDNAPTTANAGSNQTLCISSASTTLAGNTPTIGIGTWSMVSGSGIVTNSLLPNSTITGLGLGINTLAWNIANGVCGALTSTMSIQVDNLPTISNAGINQTLCVSSASTLLNGNIPLVGIGTWSITSGTGSITTPTLSNSSISGLAVGVNVLEWVISNGFCSPSTSSMSIQVDQLPTTALASPNQTTCISNPTATIFGNTPIVGVGVWSLVSGTGTIVSAASATTAITNLGLGVNVFAWTINNGLCSSTSTISITVDPAPTVANAGANQTVCITSPIATMNGNTPIMGVGTWSVVSGSGTITSINSESTTITNLGLGINVLAWTIGNSCSSTTSTISVTVDQLPTTAIAGPSQSICVSSPTAIVSGNIPTVGVGSWSLISGTGIITSSLSPTTTITSIGLGSNVFQWSITNGVCPASTSTLVISEDPLPTIANAGPNQTVCITGIATMSANIASIGTGSWNVVSGSGVIANINSENTTITGLGLGVNIFAWTIYSSCGSSVSQMTVTVDQLPTTAIAGPSQSICVTSPTAIVSGNIPTIGIGNWSLVSGSGTITSASSPTTSITNIGLGTNIFQWSITNGVCPASTSSLIISEDPLPTIANAGVNQTVCISPGVATMSANNASIGTGSWSVVSGSGTITSINSENTTITNLGLGNNVFAWTIFSNCGSTVSNVTITVDQIPTVAVASPNQSICVTSPTAAISGNVPSIGVGNWSLISGSGTITSVSSPTTTITNIGLGVNIFEWSITNGACAASTASTQITVNSFPTIPNAGTDQTICISSPAIMNGNMAAIGNGSWTVISGGGTITSPTLATTTITGLNVGVNVFGWTISNNCASATSTVAVSVEQLPSISNAGVDQSFCMSTSAILNANNASIGTGNWSVVSGGASVVSPTNYNSSVTGLTTGTNILVWTISNGLCAVSSDTVQIIIDTIPTNANAGLDQNSCTSSTTLNGNIPTIGFGAWSVIGGGSSVTTPTLNNSLVTSLSTPTNLLVWTISNGVCPSSTDTVMITILPPTTPAFAGNDTTIVVDEINLNGNNPLSGNGVWSILSGNGTINNPTIYNSFVDGFQLGQNTLQWSITDACGTTQDEVNITYIEVELPNAFSPNGDGMNDSFDVPYFSLFRTIEIKIINRWGSLVYEDSEYKNNWFGKNQNGEPLAEDTYFYVLKLNNKIRTGYITIKR